MEQKTTELGNYLIGKSATLDFIEPTPTFMRTDSRIIRDKILRLAQSDAESMGIPRSTLHYLRKNARTPSSFRVYNKVQDKLRSTTNQ